MNIRTRVVVALLTLSAAGLTTWKVNEGFTTTAIIPTLGDVRTIGHGSTRYEDGTRVKAGDTITRERAAILAKNLMTQDEKRFSASIPNVKLYQSEFDFYMNFVGQFGIGNWNKSSMRRNLIAGNYWQACQSLLLYKYAAGFDCSTPGNRRCAGVWTRQLQRHAQCVAAL